MGEFEQNLRSIDNGSVTDICQKFMEIHGDHCQFYNLTPIEDCSHDILETTLSSFAEKQALFYNRMVQYDSVPLSKEKFFAFTQDLSQAVSALDRATYVHESLSEQFMYQASSVLSENLSVAKNLPEELGEYYRDVFRQKHGIHI